MAGALVDKFPSFRHMNIFAVAPEKDGREANDRLSEIEKIEN